MKNNTTFAVRRFENRNGTTSWRVSGWLHGVRIRKNSKTKEDAATEKVALELRALQNASGIRAATTFLADDQLREAEAVFRRLAGNSRSLSFYVDFALANYRAPETEVLLDRAVTDYLAARQVEQKRGLLSAVTLNGIKKVLVQFQKEFERIPKLAELSPDRLGAFCQRRGGQQGEVALKTYNNRRAVLGTLFKFALQKEWVFANPIDKVPSHRIAYQRGSAPTLTAAQSAELMAFVEDLDGGRLVPFFALALFAGIRPCVCSGEILKLKPAHVQLDTGVIHIEPEVSKVRMKRNVTIQPNLAAWLRAYPLERFPIVPPNMQNLRRAVAKKFNLSHDVMRHTFISMFVAKFRSMGEAALQAGNSESIIRKHYLDLKSIAEADQFFGIVPKGSALPAAPTITAKPTASNEPLDVAA